MNKQRSLTRFDGNRCISKEDSVKTRQLHFLCYLDMQFHSFISSTFVVMNFVLSYHLYINRLCVHNHIFVCDKYEEIEENM